MDTINQITKKQLPLHQDFTSLKTEAIAYIQKHIGSEWTNFNPSDPGMTILDQFCYALTELGYCTDFSIPDILTNIDGEIEIENQFYLPNEILTTSPYTINDYKKYVIDGIENINNVVIVPQASNIFPFNKIYQVYVYINPNIEDTLDRINICKSAFYYLNKSRNIGETFNVPIALATINCTISGKIEIEKETNQYAVLLALQDSIRNFVFPKITQKGFENLQQSGYSAAEIFDGPALKNGWILTEDLIDKNDAVQTIDLIPVIESVNNVVSITGLQLFQEQKNVSVLTAAPDQMLFIDILTSYKNKTLILSCNGKDVPFDAFGPLNINTDNFEETTAVLNKKDNSKLPKSKFRDINTYFSIQNTFPQQYGIGFDTLEDHSKPVQVGQSRQLKGYLTLFDQILANQFSQLANISKLFSFKNSLCGAPSDEETFFALKDKYEQTHLEYPVPYKMFAPSYFYQSLYTVPHIQPLLKNSTTFDYTYGNESAAELKEKSWQEYQQDPYNPYIFGLMKLMDEENTNLKRRNKILNHLLARHGESPNVVDALIDDTVYTGDKRKDQIILKSLYLQNLGLLSYNRQKGYNFLSASKMTADGNWDLPEIKEKHYLEINENTTDFIFKSEKINKKEKLRKKDFNDFSGFELKLNLIFGLRNLYTNFISEQLDSIKDNPQDLSNAATYKTIQKALWFKEKRNGIVFLETVLLLNQLKFELEIIKENQVNHAVYSIQNISFQAVSNINYTLNTVDETTLDAQLQQGFLQVSDIKYVFKTETVPIENQNNYVKTAHSNYAFKITIPSENQATTINDLVFTKSVLLLFPDFIPVFKTPEFKKRLKQFLKISIPANVSYECLFLSSDELDTFIPNFMQWHESLRYKDVTNNTAETDFKINPVQSAMNLISNLTTILATKNGRNK
ncbi:hypothetical protein [Flavobacterium sp. N1736]|uniref:hypothetical protein n=1 Tax=Flavobacterium sp. N1736 TaxID=2986823 RepID=UPI0022250B09|nr:hypothetical protein [Flavobacterium sp. N1736]